MGKTEVTVRDQAYDTGFNNPLRSCCARPAGRVYDVIRPIVFLGRRMVSQNVDRTRRYLDAAVDQECIAPLPSADIGAPSEKSPSPVRATESWLDTFPYGHIIGHAACARD